MDGFCFSGGDLPFVKGDEPLGRFKGDTAPLGRFKGDTEPLEWFRGDTEPLEWFKGDTEPLEPLLMKRSDSEEIECVVFSSAGSGVLSPFEFSCSNGTLMTNGLWIFFWIFDAGEGVGNGGRVDVTNSLWVLYKSERVIINNNKQ
jgi:hypothetical protein